MQDRGGLLMGRHMATAWGAVCGGAPGLPPRVACPLLHLESLLNGAILGAGSRAWWHWERGGARERARDMVTPHPRPCQSPHSSAGRALDLSLIVSVPSTYLWGHQCTPPSQRYLYP